MEVDVPGVERGTHLKFVYTVASTSRDIVFEVVGSRHDHDVDDTTFGEVGDRLVVKVDALGSRETDRFADGLLQRSTGNRARPRIVDDEV